MKNICVYCGSRPGNHPMYLEAAKKMGQALVRRELNLVYGGSVVGLMGAIADEMIRGKREVIGVMPSVLTEIEAAHTGISQLYMVETMHQRKQLMADHADAFIAMPGGFGTLEEFFEILTWAQIGKHDLPCAFYNVHGYYDQLLEFIAHMKSCGFITQSHQARIIVASDPELLLDKMQHYYQHRRQSSP